MAENILTKGARVDLAKPGDELHRITVACGWNPRRTPGVDFDLDVMSFLRGKGGKCRKNEDMVYYNHLAHESGAVVLGGDNRTGEGEGDDETMNVNLDALPPDVDSIAVAITIYLADERGQNFGQVDNAYIRIVNPEKNGEELLRYDLTEDFSTETAVVVGNIYRYNGGWKFAALADGKPSVSALKAEFGA